MFLLVLVMVRLGTLRYASSEVLLMLFVFLLLSLLLVLIVLMLRYFS